MDVVIIGSGNVATVLGRMISKKHRIVHIASRKPEHAAILANEFQAGFSGYDKITSIAADLYIVAVSDIALEEIGNFHLYDKMIVHTAGSVPMNILNNVSLRYGVLYPLQTLRKEVSQIAVVPFLIDANTPENLKFLQDFALTFTENVQQANDEERLKLHTAAVIVSNFTNHLYALAEDFCNKEKVDFNLLKPLIIETANRILIDSPSHLQTGPAVRKDIQTLDKHLRLLTNYPKLRTTYLRLTDSIINSN